MWILPNNLIALNGASATAVCISDSNESCQLCGLSLAVRSKRMQLRTWLRKWSRDSWTQRLFGRIVRPSQEKIFAASWTSSLRAIRVSRSAARESGAASVMRETCGQPSVVAIKRCDRAGFSSRMSRVTSTTASVKCWRTWKRMVIGARGAYSARLKSAQAMCENESSSSDNWPTPIKADGSGGRLHNHHGPSNPTLLGKAIQWPTPSVNGNNNRSGISEKAGDGLQTAAKMWPSPAAENFRSRGGKRVMEAGLDRMAKMWTTPQAHDVTMRGSGQKPCSKAGNAYLARDAVTWPTETVQDASNNAGPSQHRRHKQPLNVACLNFPHGQTISTLGAKSLRTTRRLNPRFVAWLMGVSFEWMNCDWLATESCRPSPQKPLSLCTAS